MKSCCFTGHRSCKLALDNNAVCKLKNTIREQIVLLIEKGVDTFYTGMAEGVDLWAASEVIRLKKQYPVKLIGAIPFYGHESRFPLESKAEFFYVFDNCDEKIILSANYHPSCFFLRNEYMVDNCDCILAVYNGSAGGTRHTVDYGKRHNKHITVINPSTLEITSLPVQLEL